MIGDLGGERKLTKRALAAMPEKSVAVHCQSGKAVGHTFALCLIGFPPVRSYDRSWAEWGAADDLPVKVGNSS